MTFESNISASLHPTSPRISMLKNIMSLGAIACAILLHPLLASAEWPARVFAPYMYLGSGDKFQLTACDDACGQKFYTLAFITSDKTNNPAWDGRIGMDQNRYADQIAGIRSRGGDVILSFGGEAGRELAIAETNATSLQEKYQAVIDQYKLTWLDFDIEGKALRNTAANQRRNAALAKIQAANPKIIISYTLSVDPNGISEASQRMLADAKIQNVKVHSADLMIMDYGSHFSAEKKMSDVSIASAIKAHEQCAAIDPSIQIGLCAMIGKNDEPGELFSLDDATSLMTWAKTQPWVCSVSFWSINRDTGNKPTVGKRGSSNINSGIEQNPWAFSKIFQTFAQP
jgi:chitinase